MIPRCSNCIVKCGTNYIPYDVVRELKMGFRCLEYCQSASLLKKYLTEEVMNFLKYRKTSRNSNLLDCIKMGLKEHDCEIGIHAADPECIFTFSPIFYPILEELHDFTEMDQHPKSSWAPSDQIINTIAQPINSTKIVVSRNLYDCPFCCQMNSHQFKKAGELISMVLGLLTGDLDGTYESFENMTEDRRRELEERDLIFDNSNKYLKAAGVYRHWPTGRGIYMNKAENFVVWVNPDDHLKIITLDQGGDVGRAFRRMRNAVRKLKRDFNFIMSERMGYVTLCPFNMGTGMKIYMKLQLPNASDREKIIADQTNDIYVRAIDNNENLFLISNKKCLGTTELEIIMDFIANVTVLVDILNTESTD